jgi:putative ABC transport system permease protein
MAVPLAWQQLVREKLRLMAALAGIAFSVMLMFMQLGFRDALFDSAVSIHQWLQGDLVIVSPVYQWLGSTKSFTQRRLYQTLVTEGVESVAPVYFSLATWKNPDTRQESTVLVLGMDPQQAPFAPPGIAENLNKIQVPEAVLMDLKSRPEVGPVLEWQKSARVVVTEVNGHQIKAQGFYNLGTSFGLNGSLVTDVTNFLHLFPNRQRGVIDLGMITLKKGADRDQVLARIAPTLPADAKVMTLPAFMDLEKSYWATASPIGFIFNLGTLMGLIVGAVIVYQILYSDVSDHLAEYATLKAMGYTDLSLFGIVAQEAVALSVMGYIPGFLIGVVIYKLTNDATGLPTAMSLPRAALVFVMTFMMCIGAGALAMRKLRTADPAEVF